MSRSVDLARSRTVSLARLAAMSSGRYTLTARGGTANAMLMESWSTDRAGFAVVDTMTAVSLSPSR
jgi:hypothetical protein